METVSILKFEVIDLSELGLDTDVQKAKKNKPRNGCSAFGGNCKGECGCGAFTGSCGSKNENINTTS